MSSKDNRPEPSVPLADKTGSVQTGQALRTQAEKIMRKKMPQPLMDPKTMSPEETLRMLHELQVHQIELEMQNEELRRTHVELAATQARYFDLYDLAPVGFITISEQGTIQEANFTAATFLGVTRSALVGQPISRFILKECQDIYYLFHKQLLETGEPQLCELLMTKNGEKPFWAQLRAATAHDFDGKPEYHIVLSDITGQKQTEDALQESEHLFRKLFESHAAIKLLIDAETGNILDANQAAAEFYGWPIEQLKQMHIQQINTLSPEAVHAAMQQAALSKHARFEFHHRRADGSIREVEVFSNKIESTGKNFFFSIIHDITERKRNEEALRQSEARFQVANQELEAQNKKLTWLWENTHQIAENLNATNHELHQQTEKLIATNAQVENEKNLLAAVMEALPIGVAITDTIGGSIQSNNEYERIWGGPRPTALSIEDYAANQAWWDDTGKPVAPEEWASARAVLKGETTVGQMMRIQRFDGSVAFVINSASPVYDCERNIVGSAVAIQDITELKQAEQALLKNKEDFSRAQEVGGIGSWRLDVRRNVLTWSDENYRIFEVPTGTPLQYETFLSIVHPEDRADVDTQWKAALCGEPYDIEHRIVVGSRVKWVREKAYLELDKSGLLAGGFGITQDITERKRTEELIKQQVEELRASNEDLMKFNDAAVDRELRMIELKEEINELCKQIEQPPRYTLDFQQGGVESNGQ